MSDTDQVPQFIRAMVRLIVTNGEKQSDVRMECEIGTSPGTRFADLEEGVRVLGRNAIKILRGKLEDWEERLEAEG